MAQPDEAWVRTAITGFQKLRDVIIVAVFVFGVVGWIRHQLRDEMCKWHYRRNLYGAPPLVRFRIYNDFAQNEMVCSDLNR